MHMTNKIGLIDDPCGTPNKVSRRSLNSEPT